MHPGVSLDATQSRALDALVKRVSEEFADDLESIWLYGSRARGEKPHEGSDIDVLVLIRDEDWRRQKAVSYAAGEAVDGVGGNEFEFSVFVRTPEWLAGRREIESFFIQEVDRDKIVLWEHP